MWETLIQYFRTNFWKFYSLPVWIIKGRAFFKRQLTLNVDFEATHFPGNSEVIQFVNDEFQLGRKIILATASDKIVADRIGEHFGVFSTVLASDGVINLRVKKKLEAIRRSLGENTEFDYIGNNAIDMPIWKEAIGVYIVGASSRLKRKVGKEVSIQPLGSTSISLGNKRSN